jgi:hypothetical protein
VIDLDRSHPVLGNRHFLKNKNDPAERARVILANQIDLERDIAVQGPMSQALIAIAARVISGEKICGRCWCAPRPCHLDNYAKFIVKQVSLHNQLTTDSTPNSTAKTIVRKP